MADTLRRIKRLDDQTAASVRGSQVIGSISRAIEELAHNSVEGCAKSCIISVGVNEIIVSDDGAGIDPEAMRKFIGTQYCSSDRVASRKGESLRSIASLCVDMKIETACWHPENNDSRKRKVGAREPSKQGPNGSMIQSLKVLKNGVVLSFSQSSSGSSSSAIIPMPSAAKVGTIITIRGLFHRHIVRRKYQEASSPTEFTQIRACLRILALSYPNVAFVLKDGSTGKTDCSYVAPQWAQKYTGPLTSSSLQTVTTASPSLSVESRALILRLREMYPDEFQESSIELAFDEDQDRASSRKDSSRTNFRVFGALCISECLEDDAVRNKDLEIISINGRLATHSERLADSILSHVRRCRGGATNCSMRFIIHVSSASGELVVKDSIATTSVPQVGRLGNFLKTMIAKAIINSDQSMLHDARCMDFESSACTQINSSWDTGVKRLVKGQHIMSSTSKSTATASKSSAKHEPIEISQTRPPSSPFSSAFFDAKPMIMQDAEIKPEPNSKTEKEPSSLSFEVAFLDDEPKSKVSTGSTNSATYEFEDEQDTMLTSTMWTKQRVKGLERTIAALSEEADGSSSDEKISLTKEMLAKAEVIAQVEEKFIIIKAGGVICAVDQHAADERVALEKLENALFNPEMHDNMIIKMSHKSIIVSDILKPTKLNPSKRISVTQKDMSTVKQHWSLLQKWKFSFEESDDKTLLLTGIPSVCDRLPSVNDFLEFVRELGHFTGGDIKPAFVKNILASNACRYAIMFGDSLTHERCVSLIASLSKCEFCFICAHGRPSAVPLIDMNKDDKLPITKQSDSIVNGHVRFGPKRVIRQKHNGNGA